MRAVLQRVSQAAVEVEGEEIAHIGRGLLVLLGVAKGDTEAEAYRLAQKVAEMRLFPDEEGRLNRSLLEVRGEALVVSQFTLLGDVRRGRRPSFHDAAPPEEAASLVDTFAYALRRLGVETKTGRFGAYMKVHLINDGPVTILLDSEDLKRPRRG